jgi:PBP1b-binding outer membrane lipoprotein LpoB
MKKSLISASMALTAMLLLTGCLGLQLGGGSKSEAQYQNPTVGQQLIDLQRAKDAGAISAEEYQAQKAKLLGNK